MTNLRTGQGRSKLLHIREIAVKSHRRAGAANNIAAANGAVVKLDDKLADVCRGQCQGLAARRLPIHIQLHLRVVAHHGHVVPVAVIEQRRAGRLECRVRLDAGIQVALQLSAVHPHLQGGSGHGIVEAGKNVAHCRRRGAQPGHACLARAADVAEGDADALLQRRVEVQRV